ncbi:transposase, partial [bacterium]|nr:transposase [bacterium]
LEITPGVVAVIQTFGARINFHPHIHVLVTEGGKVRYQYDKHGSQEESMDYLEFIARVTSHIPDKGQVMVRYYGLYSNAHRGKMRKAVAAPSPPLIIEDEQNSVPSRGWAEMIRKVFEVDPLLCPSCGGQMKIISFIEDPKAIDRIIRHLKLTFDSERPPPPQVVQQELLMADEESGEYL